MIEFLLSGGPEGTNDLLYLFISNDGHYYYLPRVDRTPVSENAFNLKFVLPLASASMR